jgi:hypothetical protein
LQKCLHTATERLVQFQRGILFYRA